MPVLSICAGGHNVLKYVRVKAVATKDEDERNVLPLHLDMVIDESGNVIGDHPIFGCEGEISRAGGDSTPFMLYASGELDYGLGFDSPPKRYYELNLREGKITVGRILTLSQNNGYQETRRVDEVKSLVSEESDRHS
jgi:hypothetical protein